MRWSRQIAWEIVERVVADIVMLNAAVLSAFILRFFAFVYLNRQNVVTSEFLIGVLDESGNAYLLGGWLLTLICLAVFWKSGFYTYGRAYRGRYKALIVFQAILLAFLVFGFFSFFVPFLQPFPRSVLLGSWVLTTVFLEISRLWAYLWRQTIRAESRIVDVLPGSIRNVLVIGGAGYIGSALLPKLLDAGYRVRLLDLFLYGTEPIEAVKDHPRLEIVQGDFRQIDTLVNCLRGEDAVIHLGGIVGDPACAVDENLTIDVNVMATRMIAEVAKGVGVNRFIFASTCSVYGASEEWLNENSAFNPVSLYARSKIASERVLLQIADERFAPVILRFGTIYGLSGRTRFDLVINLLTAKAVVDHEITVFGGDQWRPFVHVDDAALAIWQILEAPLINVRNQAFNVGSNSQNYTIAQVAAIINGLVPSAKLIESGKDADRRNYRVKFDKIYHVIGFKPAWSVDDGVRQVLGALEGGRMKDYRDAKYSNVKFLNEEGTYRLVRREDGWAYQMINDTTPILPPSTSSPTFVGSKVPA